MLALLIIGSIILLIIVLLNVSLTAEIAYISEKLDIKIKYMFFTLYPVEEKKKKSKKTKKKRVRKKEVSRNTNKKAKSAAEIQDDSRITKYESNIEENKEKEIMNSSETSKKSEFSDINTNKTNKTSSKKEKINKEDIKEKIKIVKKVFLSSKKGLRRLLKNIRIDDIFIDIDVADEDAAEAAISYGKMNALVYNGLAAIRIFFTISIKKINIYCKYNTSKCRYDAACTIKLRPATALLSATSIIYHFFVNTVKDKMKEKKEFERNAIENE